LGEYFRWIETAWVGNQEFLICLKQPTFVRDADSYPLYPSLIDACFQLIIADAITHSATDTKTWLPLQIERFSYMGHSPGETLWCHGQLRPNQGEGADRQIWDLLLFNVEGQGMARIEGFEVRQANPEVVLRTITTIESAPTAKDDQILAQIKVALEAEREQLLRTYLQEQVAHLLGMKTSEIDVQQHLNYMGLDSLVAVNLRNRIQTKLSVYIPITKFMEELTIAALSTELNQQLTQLEQKHTSGLDNNQQLQSGNVNDSDWIEVDL
ncbi:MAG: hypothetical protein F6K65_42285, partial [Moorea sp. SIO3C2]|nr:hypothetical protein [Moorena sp. SIO3C2]